ncbi:cytochrome c3 family protein [Legionella resiliens]|uniref:Cytochrome c3 family protein n=1 Tax=Legionella resiliens TaxID=2905958 RepID=A0ABS8X4Y5_9GAMM|nr:MULTISPECIES: cytochrome c3 family protein [unclassified Legionella]MCE0722761.1 cytochrome c3 family protein [Legionella sp. 9fVS26]MCE3531914.1 cytochrome c3 family protein [Legionella sp. 8cVS16]
MKLSGALLTALAVLMVLFVAAYYAPSHEQGGPTNWFNPVEWQRMASPGTLSQAHSFLSHNCNACHTPVKGVEAVNCITCHANDVALLQRQPASFHADIGSCVECHAEHQGQNRRPTQMDHNAFVAIELKQLKKNAIKNEEQQLIFEQVQHYLEMNESQKQSPLINPHVSPAELTLQCTTCHQNEDKHFTLFGNNCSACHETADWNIPEFIHPSPRSKDCAQCHQAPPSHYMEHFRMISRKVAGKPHAQVTQCFMCHQTTAWTDIKGIGFYKHH